MSAFTASGAEWNPAERARLTGTGMTPETADRWLDAWVLEAARRGVPKDGPYWQAAGIGSPRSGPWWALPTGLSR